MKDIYSFMAFNNRLSNSMTIYKHINDLINQGYLLRIKYNYIVTARGFNTLKELERKLRVGRL